jgi:hypothetical protein
MKTQWFIVTSMLFQLLTEATSLDTLEYENTMVHRDQHVFQLLTEATSLDTLEYENTMDQGDQHVIPNPDRCHIFRYIRI